jgi:hypothetical protein
MKNEHHHPQDRQSLLMHREAVRMLQADPLLAERALAILARWDTHVCGRSRPLRERWAQIISERDWDAALEESERGNQLRQASPLSILLPNKVRLAIIQSVRREKDAAYA